MSRFSIEEIRKYILSQDSLGDVLYNLKAENIIMACDEQEYRCKECGMQVSEGTDYCSRSCESDSKQS